ncbi:drug/metabolite transporter (DMT)-like permease [Paenochrobactrum gallinarii]|uniref:Drug/metabolite transporter (DMT)-like permease n=1 Tax=Paenochrobactrum gallinarii TaxID=643673 RepID=A0A841M972_9HYPH|nr:DMT family transporter [Paenochrobactrum gallinarii]MBB6262094.1 drug/metabolite transporter (DMT)-like permease [Paenochrobactrum gallinarii]
MTNILRTRSELFALTAAALNGTIGPFNRFGFMDGASHHEIAFLKCFIAFLILLSFCTANVDRRRQVFSLKSKAPHFFVLAFLGIFCLYFFETWAFKEASIPLVSFLTYAAGGITIVLSAIFLGERIGMFRLIAFALIICGVFLIYSFEAGVSGSPLGILLALLGGLGYALFIFTSKLFRMGSGLAHLVWLFGFGSLYLLVPVLIDGFSVPSMTTMAVILGLVLLPTIGGFYFTTKAVQTGEASSVQIIETSDPLFATIFAFGLFGDQLGVAGWTGAACIMIGLLLALKKEPEAAPHATLR